MKKLQFNLIKKLVILPLIFIFVIFIGVIALSPKIENAMSVERTATAKAAPINLQEYPLVNYDGFYDLKLGDFVCSIRSEEMNINRAVTYSILNKTNTDKSVSLYDKSTEPWNDGSIAVFDNEKDILLSQITSKSVGNTIVLDFRDKGEYQYVIKDYAIVKSEKEIDKYMKSKTLVVCVPFNDFSDLRTSYFYSLYIAEQVN